jgi:hypothetical protein
MRLLLFGACVDAALSRDGRDDDPIDDVDDDGHGRH